MSAQQPLLQQPSQVRTYTRHIVKAGDKFGFIRIIQKVADDPKACTNLRVRWRVECVCGKRMTLPQYYLTRNHNPKKHCGCQSKGLSTTYKLEYASWSMMHQRCQNPEHVAYHYYGGRGITICDRWNMQKYPDNPFQALLNFVEDMGPRRTRKLSIDRINPDGNYEPSNCRWADAKTQRANQRKK